MCNWVILFIIDLHYFLVNQAKMFLITQFTAFSNILRCRIVTIAVAANWSLIFKRNRDLLCDIINKLIDSHFVAPLNLIFYYADLAMSRSIVVPERFLSTLPAFKAQHRLSFGNYQ